MEYDIEHRPSYALLSVDLDQSEAIQAEAGAMVSHTDGIVIETEATGGIVDSLKRTAFGGESFFMNTFRADRPGHVTLAPPLPGDVIGKELTDDRLLVQSGSFLAAETGIDIDTKFGGGRTFFGGEGLFLLELSGTGRTFLSSYGAVERVDLDPGETYTVDTGHIVAFEGSTTFDVKKVGGLKSTLFSGEGLVCEFSGEGAVWLQTRSTDAFLSWLIPNLPAGDGGDHDEGFSINF
ncbi:TIGR00266 family protein [Halorhabdus sp. BNX81]|uniref:TIGR00266 family protein n=1 Tax=Halorhabdus sp. BNX81 TaxID=2980181 RepID=UPI0023DD5E91|nr:TIGR00266 family protein [Halorhabdus sp. BNX81]WEL21306.1 AIM24 family protein [Halorhabdus sp. BNX81]